MYRKFDVALAPETQGVGKGRENVLGFSVVKTVKLLLAHAQRTINSLPNWMPLPNLGEISKRKRFHLF
jgi:hypothetical protein